MTPLAFAIGAISARKALTIAGKAGLSLLKTLLIELPSSGTLARIAFPSWDGNTEIISPGAKKSEIFSVVPSSVRAPTPFKCSLRAAKVSASPLPSNKTKVGKLKVSLPEKVAITSEAFVASAPLGRKDELLFS